MEREHFQMLHNTYCFKLWSQILPIKQVWIKIQDLNKVLCMQSTFSLGAQNEHLYPQWRKSNTTNQM